MADLAKLADIHCQLEPCALSPGGSTSALVLLIRPGVPTMDESGSHPGELFQELVLTRVALHELAAVVEQDWRDHCLYALNIDPDTGDAIPVEQLLPAPPYAGGMLMRHHVDVCNGRSVTSEGVRRIAAERLRQVAVEGFDPSNDDAFTDGELAAAAACYALPLDDFGRVDSMAFGTPPRGWPWPRQWWKPAPVEGTGTHAATTGGRIRELEKAGALIAAEIDRLVRLQHKGGAK